MLEIGGIVAICLLIAIGMGGESVRPHRTWAGRHHGHRHRRWHNDW